MITNDTIIKAAKAAGLDVKSHPELLLANRALPFNPRFSDTDNAMIMDGAEISIAYHIDSVSASFYIDEHGMHSEPQSTKMEKPKPDAKQ